MVHLQERMRVSIQPWVGVFSLDDLRTRRRRADVGAVRPFECDPRIFGRTPPNPQPKEHIAGDGAYRNAPSARINPREVGSEVSRSTLNDAPYIAVPRVSPILTIASDKEDLIGVGHGTPIVRGAVERACAGKIQVAIAIKQIAVGDHVPDLRPIAARQGLLRVGQRWCGDQCQECEQGENASIGGHCVGRVE